MNKIKFLQHSVLEPICKLLAEIRHVPTTSQVREQMEFSFGGMLECQVVRSYPRKRASTAKRAKIDQ